MDLQALQTCETFQKYNQELESMKKTLEKTTEEFQELKVTLQLKSLEEQQKEKDQNDCIKTVTMHNLLETKTILDNIKDSLACSCHLIAMNNCTKHELKANIDTLQHKLLGLGAGHIALDGGRSILTEKIDLIDKRLMALEERRLSSSTKRLIRSSSVTVMSPSENLSNGPSSLRKIKQMLSNNQRRSISSDNFYSNLRKFSEMDGNLTTERPQCFRSQTILSKSQEELFRNQRVALFISKLPIPPHWCGAEGSRSHESKYHQSNKSNIILHSKIPKPIKNKSPPNKASTSGSNFKATNVQLNRVGNFGRIYKKLNNVTFVVPNTKN